jgi:beclin 1
MAEQDKRSRHRSTVVDGTIVGKVEDKVATKVYIDVQFVCQQCTQPLKLHESLSSEYLEEKLEEIKLREENRHKRDNFSQYTSNIDDNRLKKRKEWALTTQRSIEQEEDTDSTMLDLVPRKNVSADEETLTRLQLAEQYFNALSATTPVDYPLCADCLKFNLRRLENDVLFSEEARYQYEGLLKEWEQEYDSQEGEVIEKQLEEEVEKLRLEEARLKEELASIESKRSTTKQELKMTRERLEDLQLKDKDLHRKFNMCQGEMLHLQDEVKSIEYQTTHASEQLKTLRKTNVLSMAFRILPHGLFGTINGFRLGRLTTVPVEWSEINAAWGQCALLLTCLTRYVGLTFHKFSVIPHGNQSYVLQYPEKEGRSPINLPLHTSGGYKFMLDSKFDRAMIAFLDCFSQLKNHIESKDGKYKLPYNIEKDKIGDDKKVYSIKMQGNSPEHWTKALKFLLTDLQWAMVWQQMTTVK